MASFFERVFDDGMSVAFTPSLFDGSEAADPTFGTVHRMALDAGSWLEVVPGWVGAAAGWFEDIVADAPWDQRRRRMYDQDVMEPRLTCGWRVDEAPDPAPRLAALLGERYRVRFGRVSANFYRDGNDSVAWHGDRVRFTHAAPLVAIVSLGAPRRSSATMIRLDSHAGRDSGGVLSGSHGRLWRRRCAGSVQRGGRNQGSPSIIRTCQPP